MMNQLPILPPMPKPMLNPMPKPMANPMANPMLKTMPMLKTLIGKVTVERVSRSVTGSMPGAEA